MAAIKVYNMQGSEVGTMELNDSVFAVEYRESLIHQAVVTRLANERQGTKSTLTRSEVRGGGIKPWRQKGTGRARQGSIRAPQWIKGGVVFAPKSRDFSKKMNASAKKAALLSALSKKVADGEFVVVDELKVSAPKTKEMAAFAKALNLTKTALVVMDNDDINVIRAAANLPKLETMPLAQLSTYEVVANKTIVMTKAAVEKFQEVNA
ncbi:MAG: 50S ribosomal protein L4 [Clostridiales bacterium]|nr:50S ribosomal protein L4 [Clostridiales bacterium]